MSGTAALLLLCVSPTVTDGDSIRCSNHPVALRLAGIDAPDTPAYCKRQLRVCTIGDWRASRDSLRAAVQGKHLRFTPVDTDKYGRTVAVAYADDLNLSCYQIAAGHAVFKPKWNGRALTCGADKDKVKGR